MRELLKVRIDASGVMVKYQEYRGEKAETVTLEAEDPPRAELRLALSNMAAHLCAIAELPGSWVEEIEIRSVTLTRSDGIRGLVITGLRALDNSNAPLVLNSPHFTDSPYSEADESGKGVYSVECSKALDELEERAMDYVDGKRGQLELPFGVERERETVTA